MIESGDTGEYPDSNRNFLPSTEASADIEAGQRSAREDQRVLDQRAAGDMPVEDVLENTSGIDLSDEPAPFVRESDWELYNRGRHEPHHPVESVQTDEEAEEQPIRATEAPTLKIAEYDETEAAKAEEHVPDGLIVERRKLETGAEVVGVLSSIDSKEATGIASVMEECDVIVLFSNMYANEAKRAAAETRLNEITASATDTELARDVGGTPSFNTAVASEFRDSGKPIKVLSVTAEDPEYEHMGPLVQATSECSATINELAPLSDARIAAYDYARASLTTMRAITDRAAERFNATVTEVIADKPNAKIGFITHTSYNAIIDSVGQEQIGRAPSLRDRIAQASLPLECAAQAITDGDTTRTMGHIDRHLLGQYLGLTTGADTQSASLKEWVAQMAPEDMQAAMALLEPVLANQDVSPSTRLKKLTEAIRPVIDDHFARKLS